MIINNQLCYSDVGFIKHLIKNNYDYMYYNHHFYIRELKGDNIYYKMFYLEELCREIKLKCMHDIFKGIAGIIYKDPIKNKQRYLNCLSKPFGLDVFIKELFNTLYGRYIYEN
jgi:hypothetical protein